MRSPSTAAQSVSFWPLCSVSAFFFSFFAFSFSVSFVFSSSVFFFCPCFVFFFFSVFFFYSFCSFSFIAGPFVARSQEAFAFFFVPLCSVCRPLASWASKNYEKSDKKCEHAET